MDQSISVPSAAPVVKQLAINDRSNDLKYALTYKTLAINM
jgi:hypothetical protein